MVKWPFANSQLLLNSGIPAEALLSSIIHDYSWQLPRRLLSNDHFSRLFINAPSPSDNDDRIFCAATYIRNLKASVIWDSIRHRSAAVPWYNIVWHKHHIPRYSFILWLAILKKLLTNDVTRAYSNRSPSRCPICSLVKETFDHLFFNCSYSSEVFSTVMANGNWVGFPSDWDGIISFID